MATKASKSDWNQIREDLHAQAIKVRELSQTITLGNPSGNPVVQEQLKASVVSAFQGLEIAHMQLGNLLQAYDGVVPFAGQTL